MKYMFLCLLSAASVSCSSMSVENRYSELPVYEKCQPCMKPITEALVEDYDFKFSFPATARRLGIGGDVQLVVELGKDGKIVKLWQTPSVKNKKVLEKEAIKNLNKVPFAPNQAGLYLARFNYKLTQ
jgi:outer membrane biosynthesis protein TonB